ncbi:MAG TPA: hypothetical protein VLD67_16995 [Vicinamibacterales bacterium]|nr:hypothetical protein [Vicinamibacterales bacterium]
MRTRLVRIGRDVQSRIRRLFDSPLEPDATPLDICQAVLDDIERRVQPSGRGCRLFPYARLVVRVRSTAADRAAVEAAFAGLEGRIRERLAELRCEPPKMLDARVVVLRKAPADWPPDRLFSVEYQQSHALPAGDSTSPSAVHITIVKGAASRRAYSFADRMIAIGRTAAVTGGDGRMRRNRVAFLDTVDGVTETVGRAHAHLEFDPRSREYRLFDDGSSNGTAIVRQGESIRVPPRDPRGVRVCSGDEVQVGRAVLRIVIGGQQADDRVSKPKEQTQNGRRAALR